MLLRNLMLQWFRQTAQEQVTRAARHQSSSSEETGEERHVEIAIVFPTQVEAGGSIDQLENAATIQSDTIIEHLGTWHGRPVVVAEVGTGRETTAQAVETLISLRRPTWLIAAGFASSLQAEVKLGHILLPDRIQADGHPTISVDLVAKPGEIQQTPNLHTGSLITTEQPLRKTSERRVLAEQSGAVAYELEAHGIATACQQQDTRMIATYILTESVDTELPSDLEQLLGQSSLSAKLGAAAGALWNRPSVAANLWQLHEQTLRSSDRLARFLAGIVTQLSSTSR